MRLAALSAARLALLAGPAVLSFFSGGFFSEARTWAGLAVWLLVVVGLLAQHKPLPSGRLTWLTIGSLAAFAAWTLLSVTWAPIAGSAYGYGQIAVLYIGALLAAAILLKPPDVGSLAEPAMAAGALIVVGYGLSERLVPGVLQFARSVSAQGRLEQPLTYWNAMGELAALGFVLCAALAGSAKRSRALRAAAAAAAVPLGVGLYIAFSRGALFASAAGLVTLVILAPSREQLRSIAIVLVAGLVACLVAAPMHGFTSMSGSLSTRELQGAIVFVVCALVAAAAAGLQFQQAARGATGRLNLPKRAPAIAVAVIAAGLALAVVVGAKEGSNSHLSGGAARLSTLQSNRYDYWRVALKAFEAEPLHGVGAGGWAVWWLRDRNINSFAQDAHSLPLQTLAELGLIGIGLLALFLVSMAMVAGRAHRLVPAFAAGPAAAFATYVAHSPLDWDWEMPAVTLIAMILGGALIAMAAPAEEDQSSSAIRGASRRKIQTANTQTST
jgi:hypothetical protein